MFWMLVGIAVTYTILIEVVFLGFYWIPSKREFASDLEKTARQLSEFTDNRLQAPEETTLMINLSEYTRKYLGGSLTNYEKVKYASFVTTMYGISSAKKYAIAMTKYDDDYVIMNNSTGNIDFFQSVFHISDGMLEHVIDSFNENRSERMQILKVKDDTDNDMYVIARCEWLGIPQPLYIFTAFYPEQLFHLDALSSNTLALLYKDELVASAGSLDNGTLNAVLKGEADRSRLNIHYSDSSVANFRYLYIAQPQKIVTPALLMIIGSGLLAMAASIGLMLVITKKMYRPIKGVLHTAGDDFTAGDEFAHISNTIVSLHTDMESISQSLEKYKASMENTFLHDLLIGMIPSEQIAARLSELPQLQVKGPFAAIVLKYTETTQFSGGFSHGMTYEVKQRFMNSMEKVLSSGDFFRVIDINFETQVIIVQVEQADFITEKLRNTLISVEPEYGLDIRAIIGPACEELGSIHLSYRQALHIADTRDYLASHAKVIKTEEMKAAWKETVYYPLQVEQTLINAIIHCKTSVWQSALEEIIKINMTERNASLAQLGLMLGTTVNRIMDGSQIESSMLLQGGKAMDHQFRTCRTYRELQQQGGEVFAALAAWFASEQEKSNNGLAEKMLAYVQASYKEEITLFDLADHLNLSRNYVSTLFKNSTGRNFKDYLSEYRYSQACRIIQEDPDKRIKDVAEQVGCNTEILSRLFVRYSGMLPNDYRQQISRQIQAGD
jgi:YesN/AraC family two-component response regulator